jgi:uncharacterized protein with ACT and thioredoxin-like domain
MAYEFCRVHGRRQRLLSARALGIEAAMSAPSEADAAALRSERVLAPVGA